MFTPQLGLYNLFLSITFIAFNNSISFFEYKLYVKIVKEIAPAVSQNDRRGRWPVVGNKSFDIVIS